MTSSTSFRPVRRLGWIAGGALALTLFACGGNDDDPVVPTPTTSSTLTASMAGEQEPTPTATGALGTGTLTLTLPSRALAGSITLDGLAATMAHIHLGDVGVNGAVIVTLAETAAGSGVWSVPAGTVLTDTQATAFAAGGLYFNAHSAANPGGEVRGQIGRQVHGARMTAAQEVPPGPSSATGTGLLAYDPTTKKFTAQITLTGVTATAAHIHDGAPGVNGSVIFPLTETVAGSGVWVSAANAVLTDAQAASLAAGGLYFNAHSSNYATGEIRGQIGRAVAYAAMNSAQEVPVNASLASGAGRLLVDPATRAVSGAIALTGMTATAAHIHTGAIGVSGPVIVPLSNAGAGIWNVPAATVFSADQLKAFKQGNLYFNAHSATYPGGEIRGQIQ